MKPYGKVLREERKRAGRTLEDVANLLGVSIPYVSDVERGNRAPFSEQRTIIIAKLFDTDPGPMLDAAAISRGAYELDARLSDKHREVGAFLMRGWADFTPEELERIYDIRGSREGQK